MIQSLQLVSLAQQRQVMLQSSIPGSFRQSLAVPVLRRISPSLVFLDLPVSQRSVPNTGSLDRSPLNRFPIVAGKELLLTSTRRGGLILSGRNSRGESGNRHSISGQVSQGFNPRGTKGRHHRILEELGVVAVGVLAEFDEMFENVGGSVGRGGGIRDGVSHLFDELSEPSLPQSLGNVVPLRQGVERGGLTRIESHLKEAVVSVGESGNTISGLETGQSTRL